MNLARYCLPLAVSATLLAASMAAASAYALSGDPAATPAATAPDRIRQRELVRLVRHDCGSCHGLTLQGGLGPALTREALKAWRPDLLQAAILYGRPGTAMPPWNTQLTEAEARWIAEQLLAGFPEDRP